MMAQFGTSLLPDQKWCYPKRKLSPWVNKQKCFENNSIALKNLFSITYPLTCFVWYQWSCFLVVKKCFQHLSWIVTFPVHASATLHRNNQSQKVIQTSHNTAHKLSPIIHKLSSGPHNFQVCYFGDLIPQMENRSPLTLKFLKCQGCTLGRADIECELIILDLSYVM